MSRQDAPSINAQRLPRIKAGFHCAFVNQRKPDNASENPRGRDLSVVIFSPFARKRDGEKRSSRLCLIFILNILQKIIHEIGARICNVRKSVNVYLYKTQISSILLSLLNLFGLIYYTRLIDRKAPLFHFIDLNDIYVSKSNISPDKLSRLQYVRLVAAK